MRLIINLSFGTYANSYLDFDSFIRKSIGLFASMLEYVYDYACILDCFLSVYACSSEETVNDCIKYAAAHIGYYGAEGKYYTDCYKFVRKYCRKQIIFWKQPPSSIPLIPIHNLGIRVRIHSTSVCGAAP